ncbi:hypothetical protein MAR_014582 [Mya arenaria]|uniref:Uncharacterized protein n=1 Tax=Mya arenaria TaxID=6604 RepID=A0ABY7G354_MYAAR|nr:hypothetical protein MAR_014582 [Mya arenaria]
MAQDVTYMQICAYGQEMHGNIARYTQTYVTKKTYTQDVTKKTFTQTDVTENNGNQYRYSLPQPPPISLALLAPKM